MNALDISKCRLDAVSGARHLACFLVNGAGCSFVGDQPVPPAGDRAVTPRLSEPPRMPKPARCGRRCLICNRRVLLRCGRCGRTTAGYDGLCAVSSCARHRPASLHAIGTSRRLQSRCAVRSRLWLQALATSSARTAGHRVRMSELKIRCGFRRQISSVLSTDGRTGAPVGSAAWLGVELIGQICVFPGLPRPNFREDQGARDCYKYLILVVTPAGVPEPKQIQALECQTSPKTRIEPKGLFPAVANHAGGA